MNNQQTTSELSPLRESRAKAIFHFFRCRGELELDQDAFAELAERGFTRAAVQHAINDLCARQKLRLEPRSDGRLRVICPSEGY